MRSIIGFTVLLAGGLLSAQPVQPTPPVPATPPIPVAPRVQYFAPGMGGSFLGVGVAEITSERARALNLKEEYGVEITHVDEDSPAAKAGLKTGDVVLEYNGQRVEGIQEFQRLVRETPPGRTVKLLISRNGAEQTISAVVGSRRPGNLGIVIPHIDMPDIPNVFTGMHSSVLGIEAEALSSQLAEYFGVKEGVLVRSVVKGSPADKAGIKAGDVIAKVNDTRVAVPGEVSSAVRTARAQKTFPVQIVRDRHEMTLTVTLEDDGSRTPATRVRPIRNFL